MHPSELARMKARAINELRDDLTTAVSREAGAHGTKMILLHDNTPPDVAFGKLSDDFNAAYSFTTCVPAARVIRSHRIPDEEQTTIASTYTKMIRLIK